MNLIEEIGLELPPDCIDVAVLVGNPRVFDTENGYSVDPQRLAVEKALALASALEDVGKDVHLFSALDHNFRPMRSHRSDAPDLIISCDSDQEGYVDDPEAEAEIVFQPEGGLKQLFARDLLRTETAGLYTVSKAHKLFPLVSDCIDPVQEIFPEQVRTRIRLLLEQAVFHRARIDIQGDPKLLDSVLKMQKDLGEVSATCIRIPVPCFAIYGATYDLSARFEPNKTETGRFTPGLREHPIPVVFFAQTDLQFPSRVLISKITNGLVFATNKNAYNLPAGYVNPFFVTHKGEVRNLIDFHS